MHPDADPERYPDGVPESAYQMAPREYMRRLFPRPAAAADTHEAFDPSVGISCHVFGRSCGCRSDNRGGNASAPTLW